MSHVDVGDADISGAGNAGVWSRVDSVTLFDDLGRADHRPSEALKMRLL